jgi:hypothetical protein
MSKLAPGICFIQRNVYGLEYGLGVFKQSIADIIGRLGP